MVNGSFYDDAIFCLPSKYKDALSLVTLLCPAMKTPKLSKFMEAVLNGGDIHDWLVPESEEQVLWVHFLSDCYCFMCYMFLHTCE